MAFLDNSGDIILDAVLTETGRKKLANGTFSISKFALGDDEINYTTYNKNHPSGSAYYDLEILQTPILEAFTATNANINYGLLSITNVNLLYMPDIIVNEKVKEYPVFKKDSTYYLAVNTPTWNSLILSSETTSAKYVMQGGTPTTRMILFESGINTATIPSNTAERSRYLVSTDMVDNTFTVQLDNRFLSGPRGLTATSTISNDSDDNLAASLILNSSISSVMGTSELANFSNYSIVGITDQLVDTTAGASEWTALLGPAGTMGALGFSTVAGLDSTSSTDEKYTNYGKTSQNIFGSGRLYDYIDTIVYVIGDSTGTVIQLPVRITRLVSS